MNKENETLGNHENGNDFITDVMYRFNPEYTWEYNLLQQVRWGEEDAKDDVCFYVKNWLEVIAKEEGYTLTKNGA